MGLFDWSMNSDANGTVDPGLPVRDGASQRGIWSAFRSVMASVRAYADDTGGAIRTGGTGNAYVVATASGVAKFRAGVTLRIRATRTNTDAPFLNVDGSGPKPWLDADGAPPASGRIKAAAYYWITADEALGAWRSDFGSIGIAEVAGLSTALTGKADQTVIAGLATALAGKADQAAIASLATVVSSKADQGALAAHAGDTANPHGVTAIQVGLGSVDNVRDAEKPVSTAQRAALNAVETIVVGTHDEVSGIAFPANRTTFRTAGRRIAGDGGAGLYVKRATEPAVGSRFKVQDAKGTWYEMIDKHFSVFVGGARGDGVADDTGAIQDAASNVESKGGGTLLLLPSRAPYRTTQTIFLGNGVELVGHGTTRFSGAEAPILGWASEGSYIKPEHPTDAAVVLQGHGSGAQGLSFIHDQPIPGSGPWTPNPYGFCISQRASHSRLRNIRVVNGSKGIEVAYTAASGGGTEVNWHDIIVGAFETGIRTSMVNDTMYWSNVHLRSLWYSSNDKVRDWITARLVGWDCGYTDNLMLDGIEFFEMWKAILFRNETCQGNTHSLYNATLVNVQFNLPQVCMAVENSTTVVDAMLTNVKQQTGNAFGRAWADTALQLGSDFVNFDVANWSVVEAGGQIMSLGAGAGGRWSANGVDIRNYSTVASGQVGFAMAAGAKIDLSGLKRFNKRGSAGIRVGGAGSENLKTVAYAEVPIYRRFGEASGTLNGAWQDLSVDLAYRPGIGPTIQCRLIGQINVTTAATGTLGVRVSGISAASVSGVSTVTPGFKSVDSGWVDITQAEIDGLSNLGRFQINGPSGAQWSNGGLSLLLR